MKIKSILSFYVKHDQNKLDIRKEKKIKQYFSELDLLTT